MLTEIRSRIQSGGLVLLASLILSVLLVACRSQATSSGLSVGQRNAPPVSTIKLTPESDRSERIKIAIADIANKRREATPMSTVHSTPLPPTPSPTQTPSPTIAVSPSYEPAGVRQQLGVPHVDELSSLQVTLDSVERGEDRIVLSFSFANPSSALCNKLTFEGCYENAIRLSYSPENFVVVDRHGRPLPFREAQIRDVERPQGCRGELVALMPRFNVAPCILELSLLEMKAGEENFYVGMRLASGSIFWEIAMPSSMATSLVDPSTSTDCAALGERAIELDAEIASVQYMADMASDLATDACRGDSLSNCSYWTGYAQQSLRNLSALQMELFQIESRQSALHCP